VPLQQGSKVPVAIGLRCAALATGYGGGRYDRQVATPRDSFEDQGGAIGKDDDGGGNPDDPMVTEALRIVLVTSFRE